MNEPKLIGRTISHYRIVERLGAGGMGVVYRALDLALDRSVAIKALPTDSIEEPENKQQLFEEAKAASALNHPNIVTIYEITSEAGTDYIVMEYISGRTLLTLARPRGLALAQALNYGAQIADALAAAHSAGIVHRDIKPSNIMVNDRRLVKVLDFGLARWEADDTKTLTGGGRIAGTAAYMSPEQAEGKRVDRRSDIFAFGALMYEMLTGRQAFSGETPVATLLAVVTKDPEPISSRNSEVAPEVEQLVARCLRKDPEKRWQHMDDVKLALEEMQQGVISSRAMAEAADLDRAAVRGSVTTPPLVSVQPSTRVRLATKKVRDFGIGAAVVLLGTVGYWWWRSQSPFRVPHTVQPPVLTRLTSDTGLTAYPALSPDGKFLAYASDRSGGGHLHIWLQQIGGGPAIQLTNSPEDDYEPSFSPDGTRIMFHSERKNGIYIVPILGGQLRMIASGRRPFFSPDGKRVAYWVGGDYGRIFIVDANGGSPRPFQQDFFAAKYPVWSPDGTYILFVGGESSHYDSDWWIATVEGGPAKKTGAVPLIQRQGLRPPPGSYSSFEPWAWLPARSEILFSARAGDTTNLWKIALSPGTWQAAGPPQQLTFGTELEAQPKAAVDKDGTLLVVFSSLTQRIGLWSLPVDTRNGVVHGAIERVTQSANSATRVSISADGKRMAYLVDHSGRPELWIKDLEKGAESRLATNSAVWNPMINSEGSRVAFALENGAHTSQVYSVAIEPDGRMGVPEMLCDTCEIADGWSSDGKELVYSLPGPQRIRSYNVVTHVGVDLLRHPDYSVWGGRLSPDDRWVLFLVINSPVHSRIFVAPFDSHPRAPIPVEKWIPLTDGLSWDDKPRWSADGNRLYFISQRDGFRCLWSEPLNPVTKHPAGPPVPIYHSHDARLSMMNVDLGPLSIAVARDKIVFSMGELTGNIWAANWRAP